MSEKKRDKPTKPYKNIPVPFYMDPTLFLEKDIPEVPKNMKKRKKGKNDKAIS